MLVHYYIRKVISHVSNLRQKISPIHSHPQYNLKIIILFYSNQLNLLPPIDQFTSGPHKNSCTFFPIPQIFQGQGPSGRVRKISPPPGFDPRTVQPVASRYTDWAIAAPIMCAVRNFMKIGQILLDLHTGMDRWLLADGTSFQEI